MINTEAEGRETEYDLAKDEIGKVGLDAKLARWEGHIHEVLMPKLERTVRERDSLYEEIAEGTRLLNFIEQELSEKEEGTTMETLVDMGHHFYATAEMNTTGRIFVNIGLGIYVHYTYPEAIAFLKTREKQFEIKADKLTKSASRVKVEMKIIYEAIAEYTSS
eukprot:TRINITY_DN19903_c0_g1_i1.p1 TRINITY_DN19903_c0_g1~~TRINITY_DN19903_c0_g1_i1.p1  ORF type:complete len:163 (+),score=31.81 TRINITY_DN19903_c0_g1_i1:64-552(+)